MAKANKDARMLQAQFGCKYQRALNLIRLHGLEKAIEILEEEKQQLENQK